ncbi:MAG: uracil-DNA glycosylase family protein [Minisyncoccota bacterium]
MVNETEALKKIKDEVINLKASPLCLERIKNKVFPVIGEGNHNAEIIFIGEAPGENEAKTGRPFCGRSGKLLDEFLASINIPRESVYITNIVKDRPPKNRDPLPDEIEIYAPFLDRQIAIIKPKIIATLGRFSMQYIMNRYGLSFELGPISDMHGKVFEATMPWGDKVKVVPLYHPAVAIYNQHSKATLLEDFKVLKTLI